MQYLYLLLEVFRRNKIMANITPHNSASENDFAKTVVIGENGYIWNPLSERE